MDRRRRRALRADGRIGRLFAVLTLALLALVLPALTVIPAHAHAPDAWDDAMAEFYEPDMIRIKFRDEIAMRVRDGLPVDVNAEVQSAGVNAVHALSAGGTWARTQDVSEAAVDALRQAGQANTGKPLPDLNNYMRLTLPPGMDPVTAQSQFGALDVVEWVGFVPKPVATADVPDYSRAGGISGSLSADLYQRYLDAAPDGIDARWAWLGANADGNGIRICDLEKNVNDNHGDLNPIKILTPGPLSTYDNNHGTAVMGIMGGRNNRFGVRGIAYDADLFFAATITSQGFSVAAAITRCANALRAGDIIVIEAQAVGPNTPAEADRAWNSEGLVPVEWDKENYDAIVSAVAAGRIVFEAGSNGAEDLDAAAYQTGNSGHHPFKPENDSGAILVGAGNSPYKDDETPRSPSWFTNFGATVDVQGWGDGIVTTGYGDLYPGDADERERDLWFKRSFGGTSGATPMVAAAAAVLQDTFKAVNGRVATPAEMKSILQATGTPQTGTDKIGPLPDLRAAILAIYADAGVMPNVSPPTVNPPSGTYAMPMQVTIGYGSGQSESNSQLRYTLDGSDPTEDSFIFIPSQGDTLYLNYGVTLKARAFVRDSALNRTFESPVATVTYTSSTPKVATPVITPSGGTFSQGQQFSIATTTPGATIRYRTDGRAPSFFYPGTEYTGPFTLATGTHEIVARGYKDGFYKSDAAYSGEIVLNAIQLPAPTIYPNSGTFSGEMTVYVGSTVLGADIRYTLDGSTPTASSLRFEEPIVLLPENGTQTYTVKARVFLEPYTPSNVVETVFTVVRSVDEPIISAAQPPGTSQATVTITAADADATIRYTTNGAEPTSYSTLYSGPFSLAPGLYTVRAKAFLDNADPSSTATLEVAVADNATPVTDPVITPFNTQFFVAPFTVTMRTDTPDAVIRYTFTTDGSIAPDPTAPGEVGASTYTTPLLLDENGQYRIKARAYRDNGVGGFNQSNVIGTGTLSLGEALGTATTPTIDPPGGLFTDTVEVTLSGAPNEVFFYTLDGSEPVAVPPATPPSAQANGFSVIPISSPSTMRAKAYRVFFAAGGTAEAMFDFICATPTVTPGGVFTQTVNVAMTTTTTLPPMAHIHYTTDGTEPTDASPIYAAPVAIEQTTTLKVKCFRPEFAPSATVTELYVIEDAPQQPTVTQQPEDQITGAGESVVLRITPGNIVTETVTFQWQFNGRDLAGEADPTIEIPNAQPANSGEYRVIVRDEGGQVTSQSATVTVNPAAISGLTIAADDPTPLGTPTNFAASVATGDGVSYAWDFGDGNSGDGPNPSHTYAAAGRYTVVVTASNSAGSTNATLEVQVVAAEEAVAGLTASSTSPTPLGEPTTFFATVAAGTNVTYAWDFGDGASGSGTRAEHVYTAPGRYTATVTASNSLGSAQQALTVDITAPSGGTSQSVYLPLIKP